MLSRTRSLPVVGSNAGALARAGQPRSDRWNPGAHHGLGYDSQVARRSTSAVRVTSEDVDLLDAGLRNRILVGPGIVDDAGRAALWALPPRRL